MPLEVVVESLRLASVCAGPAAAPPAMGGRCPHQWVGWPGRSAGTAVLPMPVSFLPVPTTHAFTAEQVDVALDFVVQNGAEDRGQTVSYSRVFEAAGLPSPQNLHLGGESELVTSFMERFHYRCTERGLPSLDALVVHVAGPREGFPGRGYFRVNGHVDPLAERAKAEDQVAATLFWEGQRNECRKWGTRSRRGIG